MNTPPSPLPPLLLGWFMETHLGRWTWVISMRNKGMTYLLTNMTCFLGPISCSLYNAFLLGLTSVRWEPLWLIAHQTPFLSFFQLISGSLLGLLCATDPCCLKSGFPDPLINKTNHTGVSRYRWGHVMLSTEKHVMHLIQFIWCICCRMTWIPPTCVTRI